MTATASKLFPAREKMFTFAGNLTVDCRATLVHIRTKHPAMKPEPPLTDSEQIWLRLFVDELVRRIERNLVSRKVLKKYGKKGKQ